MPLAEYEWIAKPLILTYEEITRLARVFVGLGVNAVRLTGGEPLVRKDLDHLIAGLATIEGLDDLSLTTNGALLAEKLDALHRAGLRRINVSLDTLRPDRFREITQRGELQPVLDGLFAAKQRGLDPIKINSVIERGVNEDEIIDLVDFAREHGFAIRFIEYMDVGNANHWQSRELVPKQEILAKVREHYRLEERGREQGTAPAVDYRSDAGVHIGVIASVTDPFCSSCTRARLTAEGTLVTCLFAHDGVDFKTPLREGATDGDLAELATSVWTRRTDRYSEDRWRALNSPEGYRPQEHQKIEMIRLGG
jgi:cyclic pyranopterin phosphate synthase